MRARFFLRARGARIPALVGIGVAPMSVIRRFCDLSVVSAVRIVPAVSVIPPVSAIAFALVAAPLAAAPFDQTLSARPEDDGTRRIEVSIDAMNDTLDVFDIRGRDPVYGGTKVGDYRGAHVRGGWHLAPNWWIDAALWRRKIEYRNDSGGLTSWQLGAQYRFAGGDASARTAWALRGSVWGNRAGDLRKGTPTTLAGYTIDTVRIDSPRDTQWQLDLIGTRGDADGALSWYGGVQRGRVDYSSLRGTASAGNCPYSVAFGATQTVLTQTAACTGSGGTVAAGTQITVNNDALGLDPRRALAYDATVLRVGINGVKRWGAWRLRGGVGYERHDRGGALEDAALQLSGVHDDSNISAMLEVAYRLTPRLTAFVRGTAWQRQLMGEVPFLYNAVTAKRSDRRYGVASVGVVAEF